MNTFRHQPTRSPNASEEPTDMSGFAQFTPASRRLARPAASVLLAALLGVQLAGAGLPAAAQSVAPAVSPIAARERAR